MKIIWSPTAIDDLEHVHSYISQHNLQSAGDVAAAILKAVERLIDFPASGRPGRLPDTRELVVVGTPFILPYRIVGSQIEIIAVLHGSRRWPAD